MHSARSFSLHPWHSQTRSQSEAADTPQPPHNPEEAMTPSAASPTEMDEKRNGERIILATPGNPIDPLSRMPDHRFSHEATRPVHGDIAYARSTKPRRRRRRQGLVV